MTRLEELTLKFVDDELSEAEATELQAMIDDDSDLAAVFKRFVQLEIALRAERDVDLVSSTMQRLEERVSERVEHRVMDAVWAVQAAQKELVVQTNRNGARGRRRRFWIGVATILGVLLVISAGRGIWSQMRDAPTLAQVSGEVQIKHADGALRDALPKQRVLSGETIISSGDSEVVMCYADGTEVTMVGSVPSA